MELNPKSISQTIEASISLSMFSFISNTLESLEKSTKHPEKAD